MDSDRNCIDYLDKTIDWSKKWEKKELLRRLVITVYGRKSHDFKKISKMKAILFQNSPQNLKRVFGRPLVSAEISKGSALS